VFLLVPFGAGPIGRGQTGASLRVGAEGVWWNPATIGWLTKRELAVDVADLEFTGGSALTVAYPAGRAGVLAASGLRVAYGDQDATDNFGNVIGRLYPRASVLAATYAAPFGTRVSAGVAFKVIQNSQSCTGQCPGHDLFNVSGNGFDAGIQVIGDSARRLTLGASLRNVGIGKFQTIDAEQADPLPTRFQAGATWTIPAISRAAPDLAVDATAEVVTPPADLGRGDIRLGVEARYGGLVSLRAGVPTIRWSDDVSGSGDGSRAALGFGFRRGALSIDIARALFGASANAGKPPTYVSIHVIFR
jgi:hypothetical protein